MTKLLLILFLAGCTVKADEHIDVECKVYTTDVMNMQVWNCRMPGGKRCWVFSSGVSCD